MVKKMVKKMVHKWIENSTNLRNVSIKVLNQFSHNKIPKNLHISTKPGVRLNNVQINVIGGGNLLSIGTDTVLNDCTISIYGDNNAVYIGERVQIHHTTIDFEDDDNSIVIGDCTIIYGRTHLCVIEGTSITIGKECLFADDIEFRTGDSHSILDNRGKRINYSKSISLGEHCWVCKGVVGLKGTVIHPDTIIGAGSILNKDYDKGNCIIAGNPGKIVKENISWVGNRI